MKKNQVTRYVWVTTVLISGLLAGCNAATPEPTATVAAVAEATATSTATPRPPTPTSRPPTATPRPTETPTVEAALAPAEVMTETTESEVQPEVAISATTPQTETEVAVINPADDSSLPPLVLLQPGDGEVFPDISAATEIRLAWEPVKETLAPDELYLVTIRYQQDGQPAADYAWTQETSWPVNEHAYLRNLADDGLYFWSVQLIRQTQTNAAGVPQGPALSQASPERIFVWFTVNLEDTAPAVEDTAPVDPIPPVDDIDAGDGSDNAGDSGGNNDDDDDDGGSDSGGGIGYP